MKLTTFLLLLLIYVAGHAQDGSANLSDALLWKVQKDDTSQVSYIFLSGNKCQSDIKISADLTEALKGAQAVIMENTLYDQKEGYKLSTNAVAMADSQRLRHNMAAQQMTRLKELLISKGMPERMFEYMSNSKMYLSYFMLLSVNNPCGVGAQPGTYEHVFKDYARKMKLGFHSLQSVDEVIQEINRMGNGYWKKNIQYIIDSENKVPALFESDQKLYAAGSVQSLASLYENDLYKLRYLDYLKDHTALLTKRIDEYVRSGAAFFIIDVSNVLYKEFSVFSQLRQMGYKITAVQL